MNFNLKSLIVIIALLIPPLHMNAHAFNLDYGLKLGHEFTEDMDNGDLSADLLSNALVVSSLDLKLAEIELNLGVHSYYLTFDDIDEAWFTNQELVMAALVRWSLPLVPTLLSLELGAGIDQRIPLNLEFAHGLIYPEDDARAVKSGGSRTLMPISGQFTLNVAMVQLLLEMRYNLELTSNIKSNTATNDKRDKDEVWLLVGFKL